MVFLHGGLANANYWGLQVPAVARQYQVIVMDSRGHGRSTRDDRPYGYDLMADDVVGLLDVLGIKRAASASISRSAIRRACRRCLPSRPTPIPRVWWTAWKRTRPSPPSSPGPARSISSYRPHPASTTRSSMPSARCGRPSRTGPRHNSRRSSRRCWWLTATMTRRSSGRIPNRSQPPFLVLVC
ncbi:MAG: alpha/beta fold hydrolase [Rhodopila sp.]